MQDSIDRRALLRSGGVVALATVAGCIGGDGGGDDGTPTEESTATPTPAETETPAETATETPTPEGSLDMSVDSVPEHTKYVPVIEDPESSDVSEAAGIGRVNFESLLRFDELGSGDDQPDAEKDDVPLLVQPMVGLFVTSFSVGFSLGPAGLGSLVEEESDSGLGTADEFLLAGNATVTAGDFDPDTLGEAVLAEPEGIKNEYTEAGEIDGYDLYEPAEDGSTLVAIGSEEVITGNRSREPIQTAIEAINDPEQRAVSQFSEFEWLAGAAGHGGTVWGVYSPEEATLFENQEEPAEFVSTFEAARGYVSSATLEDGTVRCMLAATFPELTDDDKAKIESVLEGEENDLTVSFDGGRVLAEATYDSQFVSVAYDTGSS